MSSVHGLSIPTVLSAEERASIYNNINYSSPLFWVEKKNCIRNKSCQGKPKKKTLPPSPSPLDQGLDLTLTLNLMRLQ